jgi:hypothetical protein
MNEIEKLMENAGCLIVTACHIEYKDGSTCNRLYPTFTEHKQLELIKWLAHKYILHINYIDIKEFGYCLALGKSMEIIFSGKTFADALANLINALWENLSAEDKEEIRGILQ